MTDFSRCTQSYPEFYIVGAARSGTTALWSWLRQHKDVCLPDVKEPGFFSFGGADAAPRAGHFDANYVALITVTAADYKMLYAGAGDQLRGDVSPVYLTDAGAAARINQARPDAKIVIILRDPVRRAFSQYLHHLRDGLENLHKFEDALAAELSRMQAGWSWGHGYAANGHYLEQIKSYTRLFAPVQILFLLYEDLQTDAPRSWQMLCEFLELAPCEVRLNDRVNATVNLSGVPAFPAVERMIRMPGKLQRVLKCLMPQGLREMIRQQINGASRRVPALGDATAHILAGQYLPERATLARLTGLDLRCWGPAASATQVLRRSGYRRAGHRHPGYHNAGQRPADNHPLKPPGQS